MPNGLANELVDWLASTSEKSKGTSELRFLSSFTVAVHCCSRFGSINESIATSLADIDTRLGKCRRALFEDREYCSVRPMQERGGLRLRLILLRHKFLLIFISGNRPQHGQRSKVLTRARVSRARMVAIEFEMWRSGRAGGSSGSIIGG